MAEIQLEEVTKVYSNGTRPSLPWICRSRTACLSSWWVPPAVKRQCAAHDRRPRGSQRRLRTNGRTTVNAPAAQVSQHRHGLPGLTLNPHITVFDNMAFGLPAKDAEDRCQAPGRDSGPPHARRRDRCS